ncbi:MAG: Lrp/AsnC family transcriptional regulator [Alphaproteobacteria bacterium]|nr:MAG: Lrp/AsnC family transcriptional regulator [Alphaproteobacteria bacterium]
MQQIDFDAIDRSILHQLQNQGRMSNADLADRVGLSPSACLRRVRQLEDSGIIQDYVALLNQDMTRRSQNVFVQITLKSQEGHDLEAFEAQVNDCPEVMECYLMSGDQDYILRVIVKDAQDYERLHREFLTRLPGVDRVRSSFALRTVRKKTELPID